MKLTVYSKKQVTKGGKEFPVYWTYLTTGNGQKKSFNVKFTSDCRKPSKFPCVIEALDDNEISLPKFDTAFKGRDGKMIYPTVWIRGFESYVEIAKAPAHKVSLAPVVEDADEEIEIESDF